jgi:hypothetical protein
LFDLQVSYAVTFFGIKESNSRNCGLWVLSLASKKVTAKLLSRLQVEKSTDDSQNHHRKLKHLRKYKFTN